MLETVRRWLSEEPVRVWLYGVIESLAALLVLYGALASATVPIIMGVVAAVLAVPVVKKVRNKVTPVAKAEEHFANFLAQETYIPCDDCPDANCGRCLVKS